MEAINIGKRREVFWDDTVIDMKKTGTAFILHEPVRRECVITHKGACAGYSTVFKDGDTYRLYFNSNGPSFAYAESKDGIHWDEPDLRQIEHQNSLDNNYLGIKNMDTGEFMNFDGFSPFIDTNPDCKPEERIKAVADHHRDGVFGLWYYTSADGIHFTEKGYLKIPGGSSYDSLNTLFYNNQTGTYQIYFRGWHAQPLPGVSGWQRSISFTECETLDGTFTEPKLIYYDNPIDWQMYCNGISKYPRADHVYIGMPFRYIDRGAWEQNFDDLCGYENRKERAKNDPRYGTAISDGLFMTSRDGMHWKRYPDAFLRPGPEHETAWVYGSAYASRGVVETPSTVPGCDNELSFYCGENRWFEDRDMQIYRYTLRLDGFVSQWGPWHGGATLTTKPIIFDGKEMFINFSTSAYGGVQVTIENLESHERVTSCDMMGDSCDRHVHFGKDLSDFAGKPCVVSFKMRDANMYSMIFR